ncbi:MAG: hypothetical protein DRH89_02960 [Candidatus Cloacimonadota bacterium]|nr:MAG: hypothetical protein DRI23_02545 [Candidatus Cloacimonadota bacterium]RLC57678.1 MAG: hypothetical protein DRH89_02960 [Candidatus Cloacimonadota bacterium]
MKQITCRNCGKQVSSKAKRCKYCGAMLRLSTSTIIIIISIVVFIAAFLLIGILQTG